MAHKIEDVSRNFQAGAASFDQMSQGARAKLLASQPWPGDLALGALLARSFCGLWQPKGPLGWPSSRALAGQFLLSQRNFICFVGGPLVSGKP